jgi:alpha-beta hydrolase superfamily lysophospholipase
LGRGLLAALVVLCIAAACSEPSATTHLPTPASPSASPIPLEVRYAPYSASYRTTTGETWVVSLQGLLVNLRSGIARALAPEVEPRFSVGPSVGVTEPQAGEVIFQLDASGRATQMTGHGTAIGDFVAPRIALIEREVHFMGSGVTFGATLTEPAGGKHLPAVALIHGSGPQPRPLFSLWANFYASLGFAVLNYDKRGTGESGGRYPGDSPTREAISTYAGDAVAAARYLRSLPEVDRSRVGLYGGSQGGWILPLALQRAPGLTFGIVASGPAVTADQTDVYQNFSADSSRVPAESDAEIDAQVSAVTTGYDPAPALRALHVPTLWVYGEKDRQVPVRLSIRNLHRLRGKDLAIVVLPGGWHGLTQTPNGLESEEAASNGFGDLWVDIARWARAHRLTTINP